MQPQPDDARTRTPHPCLDELVRLYVDEGLSTYRIGALVGLDRQAVARRLRRAGVAMPARGAGRARPLRCHEDPDALAARLRELSIDKHLTATAIGQLLGIPARTVRDRLHAFDIATRTRGRCNREDRVEAPTDTVRELYVLAGMTAEQVGACTGVPARVVLRTAHDDGLPVRVGGPPPVDGPRDIRLMEALYSDELVTAILHAHHVPQVRTEGPIWARFPQPVPLHLPLLTALYHRAGLALRHIELVTGQPAHTIGRTLRAGGIPLRARGGRAPFLRRWRTATAVAVASA